MVPTLAKWVSSAYNVPIRLFLAIRVVNRQTHQWDNKFNGSNFYGNYEILIVPKSILSGDGGCLHTEK
jgi:hypothetical protein